MGFGFTNDDIKFAQVIAFREAAIADGWEAKATYDGHEEFERASSLECGGYEIMILSRDNSHKSGKWKYQAEVSIWGPDGLSIDPPEVYDFKAIEAGAKTCLLCGDVVDEVYRYSFAGKACSRCLPKAKEAAEYPGWNS